MSELHEQARDIFQRWCADATKGPWKVENENIPDVIETAYDARESPFSPIGEADARLVAGIVGSPEIRTAILEMLDDPVLDSEPGNPMTTWERRYRDHARTIATVIVRFDEQDTHQPWPVIPPGSVFRADTREGKLGDPYLAGAHGVFFDLTGRRVNADSLVPSSVRDIVTVPAS